jgi:hypothetical protein
MVVDMPTFSSVSIKQTTTSKQTLLSTSVPIVDNKMPPKQWGWSEKDMQEAIAQYRAGKYAHAASAAAAYGIPARTLCWCLKNGDDMSQSKGHVHQQLLTPAQVRYIFHELQIIN